MCDTKQIKKFVVGNGHEKTLLPPISFTTLVLVLWLVRAGATNQYMGELTLKLVRRRIDI